MNYYILELGGGWSPTILETEREMMFIREAQKGFSDARSYWIGGFTDFYPSSIIEYHSDYFISRSGSHPNS